MCNAQCAVALGGGFLITNENLRSGSLETRLYWIIFNLKNRLMVLWGVGHQ